MSCPPAQVWSSGKELYNIGVGLRAGYTGRGRSKISIFKRHFVFTKCPVCTSNSGITIDIEKEIALARHFVFPPWGGEMWGKSSIV